MMRNVLTAMIIPVKYMVVWGIGRLVVWDFWTQSLMLKVKSFMQR